MEHIIVLISVIFSVVVLGKIVVSLAITEAAYTPMLHFRIFTETEKYCDQEFTTCKVFKTNILSIYLRKFILFLFFYFFYFLTLLLIAGGSAIICPILCKWSRHLLEAAKRVEPFCDYVDINLG